MTEASIAHVVDNSTGQASHVAQPSRRDRESQQRRATTVAQSPVPLLSSSFREFGKVSSTNICRYSASVKCGFRASPQLHQWASLPAIRLQKFARLKEARYLQNSNLLHRFLSRPATLQCWRRLHHTMLCWYSLLLEYISAKSLRAISDLSALASDSTSQKLEHAGSFN